jgi:hypothetical protein
MSALKNCIKTSEIIALLLMGSYGNALDCSKAIDCKSFNVPTAMQPLVLMP